MRPSTAYAPKCRSRVVVAMSGGVDSSVAAGLLKAKGHEVIGISLQLHDMAKDIENKFGSCCSLFDLNDARRVAEKLDIPFYVTDMEREFESGVIDDFVTEYLAGRTPNPCVRCNEKVKFQKLMDWAMDLGAHFLATGHYAEVRVDPLTNQHQLWRGKDPHKDQSYFLFTLKPQDLARTLFPVGGLSKPEVRAVARQMGLATAEKPDSQEICFVGAKSYAGFIEEKVDPSLLAPGPILDNQGNQLGHHSGLHRFTIGQRKGLGVASTEPLYVLKLDRQKNAVIVGPEQGLYRKKALVSHLNWLDRPTETFAAKAKIRYRAPETPVEVTLLPDGRASVTFQEPQRAVTPGQVMVFYEGERVLGGGWIEDLSCV